MMMMMMVVRARMVMIGRSDGQTVRRRPGVRMQMPVIGAHGSRMQM